jgi:outer membrane lipoprotein-sorting protein
VAVLFAALRVDGYAQSTTSGRQLLDSLIQAIGGQVFLEVREIETKGRFYQFKRDQIAAADLYTDYLKFPDMERTEFGKEKQKTIQINRGTNGWMVHPPVKKGDPEVEEQSPAQTQDFLDNFKTSFDYMLRFVANAPQASVLNSGTEVVDFKRTDVLEIRDAQKNLMRIFIDRETHLPMKTQTRLAGESTVHEDVLANWHRFDGVMTPLMIVRYKDGVKMMEVRTESVEYNPGFPDSLFSPPEKSKTSSK